jgi:hypothetical protein
MLELPPKKGSKNVKSGPKTIALLTGILPYFLGGLGQKKCDNLTKKCEKFDKKMWEIWQKNVKKMWKKCEKNVRNLTKKCDNLTKIWQKNVKNLTILGNSFIIKI